ncbi:MAG: LamG-like jellyroll fold domain-containing protein [Ekhidna sp.]
MKKIRLFAIISFICSFSAFSQCNIASQSITEDFNAPVSCWSFTATNNLAANFTGVSGGVLRMIPKHIGSLAVLPRVYNGNGMLSFDITGLGTWQVGVMSSPSDGGSFIEIANGVINSSVYSSRTIDFSSYQGDYQYVAILVTKGVYANANVAIEDLTYTSGCPINEFAVFNVNEDISVALDAAGNANITVADINLSSVTTCGNPITSLSLDASAFTCADIGVNNVNLTATYLGNTIGVLSVPITVEDNIAPIATGQNIAVNVDANTGLGIINASMIDNGSSDNCSGSLVKTLSKTTFRCEDTGDNIVTLSVEDASGNVSSTDVTVTVTSVVVDESVTPLVADFCTDGSTGTTISTGSSQLGFNYSLRNSATNTIVDGPYAGTGNAIDFATGNLSETTTFNVLTEKVRTATQSALEFDGIDDYVNFGTDNRGIAAQITLASWVKTTATAAGFLIAKYDGTNGFLLFMDANGNVKLDGRDGSGSYRSSGVSTTAINDNEWHYVVGTINVTTGNWRIYVDGVQENGATHAAATTLASTANLYFGAQSAIYFAGSIDQATIWNTELDASTILSNYNACLTGSETGIVGHYIFEDGSGTTLTDQSVSAIDGALTNMDGATDWIQVISPSCAEKVCEYQMSTEVTIGDQTPPIAVAQDFTLPLNNLPDATLTIADINNGSSDNCTSAPNLILSLDKTVFTCDDIGSNSVVLTVEDEAGNTTTATATVTVTSSINDETVTIADASLCASGTPSTTVSIASSVVGVNYFLRNSSDDAILDGPIPGTGSALNFSSGVLSSTTTFNVLAESEGITRTVLDFDGSDDFVNTGNGNRGIVTEITVATWIKSSGTGTQIIASNFSGTSGVILYLNGGNVAIDGADGAGYKSSGFSTTSINDNEWHYVAGVIDVSTGVWEIYVDGELENSTTNATGTTLASTTDLIIGFYNGLYFDGSIDELSIWNSALDQSAIQTSMGSSMAGTEPNVVGHYQFGDAAGSVLTDASTLSLNGTLTNMDPATDWRSDNTPGCQMEMSMEVSVALEDNIDPTAVAQDLTIQLDAAGNATLAASSVDNGSSDNCSITQNLQLSLDKTSFSCADLGANTVMLTVEDEAGNQSSTSATVTVEDNLRPTVSTQNITVPLDASGNASINAGDINDGSSDLCTSEANLIFSLDKHTFTCADLGANAISFTVEDESGNQSTETAQVTVVDNLSPIAITQDITLELDATGNATIDATQVNNGSNDNCRAAANLTLGLDVSTFNCSDLGANTVNITVTDESGNQTTESATITVVDLLVPMVVTRDISVFLDDSGSAAISASEIDNGSNDNCTSQLGLVMSLDISSFNQSDVGANTVTLSVEDANGNVGIGQATVTIVDKTPQVISFTVSDKQYGDAPFTLLATSDAGLPVSFNLLDGPASLSGNTLTITGVGTIMIEAFQSGDATYHEASAQQTFTVNPATLTISATDQTITYGDAIPSLEFSYSGFGNGEDASVLIEEPVISTVATSTSDAGTYDIVLSGGMANNYVLSLINGTLLIEKADQIISIEAIEDKEPSANPFDVIASVNSGLDLSYEVSGPATIVGTTITLDGTEGLVTVTVSQLGDINRNSASSSITFNVATPLAIGDEENSIKLYPNPTADYLYFDIPEIFSVRIFSMDGRIRKISKKVNKKMDVSDLAAGSYLVEITVKDDKEIHRMIKVN